MHSIILQIPNFTFQYINIFQASGSYVLTYVTRNHESTTNLSTFPKKNLAKTTTLSTPHLSKTFYHGRTIDEPPPEKNRHLRPTTLSSPLHRPSTNNPRLPISRQRGRACACACEWLIIDVENGRAGRKWRSTRVELQKLRDSLHPRLADSPLALAGVERVVRLLPPPRGVAILRRAFETSSFPSPPPLPTARARSWARESSNPRPVLRRFRAGGW